MKRKFAIFGLIASAVFLFLFIPSRPVLSSTTSTHGLVGGTLAELVAESDFTAFVLGFFSHALLDMMPHHDPSKDDPFEMTFYTIFNLGNLFVTREAYEETGGSSEFMWGTIGGMLPDLEHLFYLDSCTGGYCPNKFYPSHNGTLPHNGDASFIRGYTSEAALIGISISINF